MHFKCIYRQCCQSCLSAAPAVLIYRQLYLVVMLFLGSKRCVCRAQKKISVALTLARFWSPCLFFAFFYSLFHLPSWSDAISSGSVSPHLSPFSGPTESLLANVSLFLSTHSTITKVTWYRVHRQQCRSQHNTMSLSHAQKSPPIYSNNCMLTQIFICWHSDAQRNNQLHPCSSNQLMFLSSEV